MEVKGSRVVLALVVGLCLWSAPPAFAAQPTDVLFVVDATGSMDDAIDEARDEIYGAMDQIGRTLPDVQFGVGQVRDYYPTYGDYGDQPWEVIQPVTGNRDDVTDAVYDLEADGGGDNAEAYSRALYEADLDPQVGWRPGARRLI